MNSPVKTPSGAKLCFFSGNVAPGLAEVGPLFLRARARRSSILGQKLLLAAGARRIVTAARNSSYWVAEATKELAGRQHRAEVARISGCSEAK